LIDKAEYTVVLAIAMPVILRDNAQRFGQLTIDAKLALASGSIFQDEIKLVIINIKLQIQEIPDGDAIDRDDPISALHAILVGQATRLYGLDLYSHLSNINRYLEMKTATFTEIVSSVGIPIITGDSAFGHVMLIHVLRILS
jgi:hypothetical protein